MAVPCHGTNVEERGRGPGPKCVTTRTEVPPPPFCLGAGPPPFPISLPLSPFFCYVGEMCRHLSTRLNKHPIRDKASHIYKHLVASDKCRSLSSSSCFSILVLCSCPRLFLACPHGLDGFFRVLRCGSDCIQVNVRYRSPRYDRCVCCSRSADPHGG